MPEAPFIEVSAVNGRVSIAGTPSFTVGHRLPRADLPTDDGIFGSWEWRDDTLTVNNDRYGFRPLFYSATDRSVTVSPSIQTILARGAPRTLDDAAIAVFLRLNFFIGDDTPFASVRAVPPAARLTWRAGRLEIEDRRPPIAGVFAGTRHAAIDAFLERFTASVQRRLPGGDPVILPLSGGRDSRHILFALDRAGVRPETCLTVRHYPPRRNDDATIAAQLAALLGLNHIVLDPPRARIDAERRKNALTDLCSDEHVQFLPLRDYLLGRSVVSYDGIAGDILTQSWTMPPEMAESFAGRDVHAAAQQLFSLDVSGYEAALGALLKPSALRRFNFSLALERLSAEVERYLGGPNGANTFYFWNRTRREVALSPYGLLGFLPRMYAPFVDADVFDFMMTLPVALVVDGGFQVDAIRRAYPRFDGVPFEKSRADAEVPAYARRIVAQFARVAASPSRFVRHRYVWPRAIYAAAKGRTGPLWFLPLAVWLYQVESVMEGALLEP